MTPTVRIKWSTGTVVVGYKMQTTVSRQTKELLFTETNGYEALEEDHMLFK